MCESKNDRSLTVCYWFQNEKKERNNVCMPWFRMITKLNANEELMIIELILCILIVLVVFNVNIKTFIYSVIKQTTHSIVRYSQ